MAKKIEIDRISLLNALNDIIPVISTKPSIPILGNVKIETCPDGMFIMASDLEITYSVKLEGDFDINDAVVNAVVLKNTLAKLKDDTISIEFIDSGIKVYSMCGEFNMPSFGIGKDFPVPPELNSVEPQMRFIVDGESITRCLRIASRFTDKPESLRHILTGVLLQTMGSEISIVATDATKMAVMKTDIKPDGSGSFILPQKFLTVFTKKNTTDKVSFTLFQKNCMVEFDDTIIVIRLIDGEFPAWQSVIPQEFDYDCIVNTEEYTDGVVLCNIGANMSGIIKNTFSVNKLNLKADDGNYGYSSVIDVSREYKFDTGIEFIVAFQAESILAILKSIDVEHINVRMNDPKKAVIVHPAIINGEGEEINKDVLFLIMPFLVN